MCVAFHCRIWLDDGWNLQVDPIFAVPLRQSSWSLHRPSPVLEVIVVHTVVIAGFVVRLCRQEFFFFKGANDTILNHLSAYRVNRVGDISVEFCATILV